MIALPCNTAYLAFDQRKIFLLAHTRYCGVPVKITILLCARTLNRRPFTSIKQTELNASLIGQNAHDTIKSVNLANKMSLPKPANRRIARHCSNIAFTKRNQRCLTSHPRSRHRRFDTGMTSANDNNIELFHVEHYFPMQKDENISSR